jgi:hypothetical protein
MTTSTSLAAVCLREKVEDLVLAVSQPLEFAQMGVRRGRAGDLGLQHLVEFRKRGEGTQPA